MIMNKIVITRAIIGLTAMQVCAEKNVSDKDILDFCNRENLCGTTGG